MVTRKDYTSDAVEAARSVLIEVMHLLGEYKDNIVLIGGWIPEILFSSESKLHVGSLDVDLALDHRKIKKESYNTIQELLLSRGYRQGKQPFIFHRSVMVGSREIQVQVDLLSGEYGGTGKRHRHQKIHEVHARKVRGCDLAFEMSQKVTIEGELPGGGKDSVTIKIASIVAFFVMKGMALDERLKEKDAWDIYFCIRNYKGGIDKMVQEFKPHINNGLVQEGLKKIAKHFASENHIGPKFVADFEELTDPGELNFLRRDAYERVNAFMEKLCIILTES